MTTQTITSAPAKVQRLLDIAAKYDTLVVQEFEPSGLLSDLRSWTIKTTGSRSHDDTQIWIHWYPAANGGRVSVTRYRPWNRKHPRKRMAQRQTGWWITTLAGH